LTINQSEDEDLGNH